MPECTHAGSDRSSSYLIDCPQYSHCTSLSDRTIQRYRQLGVLTPDVVSPGGHARWNVEKVRQKLREIAEQGRDDA